MRTTTILILFFSFFSCFGQSNSNPMEIYTHYQHKKQLPHLRSMSFKIYLKDTVVDNLPFKKYQIMEFMDIDKEKKSHYIYEYQNDKKYIRLNSRLEYIHLLDLTQPTQTSFMFNTQEKIAARYVAKEDFDFKNKFAVSKTLNAYSNKKEKWINFSNDMKSISGERNDSVVIEKIKNYHNVSYDDFTTSNKEIRLTKKFTKGDEIQFLLKNRIYKDSLRNMGFKNNNLLNVSFLKDTVIRDSKTMILLIREYTYDDKKEHQAYKIYSSFVSENHINKWMYNVVGGIDLIEMEDKVYKNTAFLKESMPFVQIISNTYIGKKAFPVIRQYCNDKNNIVFPFFPINFNFENNEEIDVTYFKKGVEVYGNKMPFVFPNETYIIYAEQLKENEITIEFYLHKNATVNISLPSSDKKLMASKYLKKGKHSLKLKADTNSLKKLEQEILLNYKHDDMKSGTATYEFKVLIKQEKVFDIAPVED